MLTIDGKCDENQALGDVGCHDGRKKEIVFLIIGLKSTLSPDSLTGEVFQTGGGGVVRFWEHVDCFYILK